MAANPIRQVFDYGQSIWYDNIRRSMIASGELNRMIQEDGLRGVTSNPTIFEKAISGSSDYDSALQEVEFHKDKEVTHLFEYLAVDDIQHGADLLRPLYDESRRLDGYISLEVSPFLAHNTSTTISEAKRLWKRLDRPNVMIKVPGTDEGLPAIEELIASGINVNVTLLFSNENYEKVAWAYITGLERRAKGGDPLDSIASVASFFVSRIDSSVDHQLEEILWTNRDTRIQLTSQSLMGKIAIANAKMAYRKFREIFSSSRFEELAQKGARRQRPLWASTGTKNPHYSDVLYVNELIGPDTVNTIPPATYLAFRDHGQCRASLEENIEEARHQLEQLARIGVDLKKVTLQLQEEGVRSFAQSFETLMHVVETKRHKLLGTTIDRQTFSLGSFQGDVDLGLQDLSSKDAARRIWMKDGSLWKSEKSHQQIIQNALGWLTISEQMLDYSGSLMDFSRHIKEEGFRHVVLAGMGGSSLCPEVCRMTFGVKPGYPELHVLDSTDPATIARLESHLDPSRTLFIIASKSGGTTETISHFKYFWKKVSAQKVKEVGRNFVAITDPGTSLEKLAHENHFRRVFESAPTIGGRYSALSYFGLIPLALLGIDLHVYLDRVQRMVHSCSSALPLADNPAAVLGATLGVLAERGRDKATFVLSPEIQAFGYWVEQLIAESTGKEGKGILPVEGEPLGPPSVYRNDRVFVYFKLASSRDDNDAASLSALEAAGHPVIRIQVEDLIDLGEEFFRWEFATAVTGILLGVNVFDQPNVQESKDNTKRVLSEFEKTGRLPEFKETASAGLLKMYGGAKGTDSMMECLAAHFSEAKEGDYVALMAYMGKTPEIDKLLQEIRVYLRDALRLATTLGYGPRFLHSTGQLHKGGANTGIFLQITSDNAQDLAIPGEEFSFGVLKQAQAIGDLQSLMAHGRRVVRIHMGADLQKGLRQLLEFIQQAVPKGRTSQAG